MPRETDGVGDGHGATIQKFDAVEDLAGISKRETRRDQMVQDYLDRRSSTKGRMPPLR